KGKKRSLKAPTKDTLKKRAIIRPIGSREPQGTIVGVLALRLQRSHNITPST
ncbi:hypothetical protein P154DRAFT_598174, partial [Amniculicola lignicola CBS 123094]